MCKIKKKKTSEYRITRSKKKKKQKTAVHIYGKSRFSELDTFGKISFYNFVINGGRRLIWPGGGGGQLENHSDKTSETTVVLTKPFRSGFSPLSDSDRAVRISARRRARGAINNRPVGGRDVARTTILSSSSAFRPSRRRPSRRN